MFTQRAVLLTRTSDFEGFFFVFFSISEDQGRNVLYQSRGEISRTLTDLISRSHSTKTEAAKTCLSQEECMSKPKTLTFSVLLRFLFNILGTTLPSAHRWSWVRGKKKQYSQRRTSLLSCPIGRLQLGVNGLVYFKHPIYFKSQGLIKKTQKVLSWMRQFYPFYTISNQS